MGVGPPTSVSHLRRNRGRRPEFSTHALNYVGEFASALNGDMYYAIDKNTSGPYQSPGFALDAGVAPYVRFRYSSCVESPKYVYALLLAKTSSEKDYVYVVVSLFDVREDRLHSSRK